MLQANPPKKIVVYADDDPDDIILVEQAFLPYSDKIELKPFMDGAHALAYLERLPKSEKTPCLIVLDINMPVMSGKKVLTELRKLKRYAHTSVVLFSTSSLKDDRLFAERYGATYISKPMNMRQLEEIIKQFAGFCMDNSLRLS